MHFCIQRAKNTGFYGPRNVKKTPRRKLIVKNNNISYHDPTCFLRTFSYAVALWSHLESKDPATTKKSLAGNNNLEEFPFLALPRCWLIATTSEKNSHGDTSELTWKEFARKKRNLPPGIFWFFHWFSSSNVLMDGGVGALAVHLLTAIISAIFSLKRKNPTSRISTCRRCVSFQVKIPSCFPFDGNNSRAKRHCKPAKMPGKRAKLAESTFRRKHCIENEPRTGSGKKTHWAVFLPETLRAKTKAFTTI